MNKIIKNKRRIVAGVPVIVVLLAATGFLYIKGFFCWPRQDDKAQQLERLKSLPYLSWVPVEEQDREKKGVVKYLEGQAYDGLSLYTSRPASSAQLIDMKGNVVHSWALKGGSWQDVALSQKGELFFQVKDKLLGKLDMDSNLIWKKELRFHHWIHLAYNGDIYALSRDRDSINYKGHELPILNDYITVMSSDGEIKRKISLNKLFSGKVSSSKLRRILKVVKQRKVPEFLPYDTAFDVFHTNSVKVLESDKGLWKKGDILVSVRNLNTIAVIDPENEKIKWSWGKGVLDGQHDAEFLDNGNISVFDNGRRKRDYSRVLVVDPVKNAVVYEYKATPPSSFYSKSRGAAKKMPNGDWLITESDNGYVFEINADGEKVWEFFNPDMIGKVSRAAIFRMQRFEKVLLDGVFDDK